MPFIIFIYHTYIHTAKFWGFKENSAEFRSFIFTDPKAEPTSTITTTSTTSSTTPASSSSASSNSVVQNTTSQIGQIKVIIHEAILKDGLFDNKCGKPSSTPLTNDPTTTNTNNTNTKFWMQPSVGTGAGRSVTGKDEFKPVAKWENKSSIPTQTILLKYHTQLNYDLLYKHSLQLKTRKQSDNQTPTSSSIPLLKRIRYDEQTNTVDLTTDDEDGHNSDPITSNNTTSNLPKITMNTGNCNEASESQTPFEEEVVNDEVTLVRVPKIIPFVDMTNEESEPQWSSCTVDR